MKKSTTGFTIIELLVVVAILGIITSLAVLSFSRVQINLRDNQRLSRSTIITEALEKYYDKNGEYPGCLALGQTPDMVVNNVLQGIDKDSLTTPTAAKGTNSILNSCSDLIVGSNSDAFAYIGDISNDCLTGQACLQFTFKYRQESNGEIISINSRHQVNLTLSPVPTLTATTASTSEINLSWTVVNGANNYNIQRSTNEAFSANLSTQSSNTNSLLITGLSPDTVYYFRVQAVNSSSIGGWSNTANARTNVNLNCPANFITVPGSVTFNQNSFCVMKYEAKEVGKTGVPIAQAAEEPWVSITQTEAATVSQNLVGCTGCHLITEKEWLTIAQNIMSVPSNWSGGAVGSGFIYGGHNNGNPSNAIAATTDDNAGYFLEVNPATDQRRTFKLSNNEVIWDFAGNVWEWTSGITAGTKPGNLGGGLNFREWNAVITHGNLSPDPSPDFALPMASGWNSAQGLGMVYSDANDANAYGFIRGGGWYQHGISGIYALLLVYPPNAAGTTTGFRISR